MIDYEDQMAKKKPIQLFTPVITPDRFGSLGAVEQPLTRVFTINDSEPAKDWFGASEPPLAPWNPTDKDKTILHGCGFDWL